MRFVQHRSNNRVLGAPTDWDQSKLECGALSVTDVKIEGQAAMLSYWEPDEEDRKILAAGGKIRLFVWGTIHPPVAIDAVPE